MDAGQPISRCCCKTLTSFWKSAGTAVKVLVVALTAASAFATGGCGTSKFMDLPDLASQSPSKQPGLSPAEQQKAINDLIARRNQQATEAASGQPPAAAGAK